MNAAGEITLRRVSVSYRTEHQRIDIFRNLDFSIAPGEFVAIMGPSGRGKSTLLNLIAGFIKPDRGDVTVSGKVVNRLKDRELNAFRNREIGFVFQFFNLISKFRVEDNVAVPLLIRGEPSGVIKAKTREMLQKVGMIERSRHYPEQLSGGEQQRVAIARALIHAPNILLADEPTGNLDKANAENILRLFRDIHDRTGITVVVVSHDDTIRSYASRVVNIEELTDEPMPHEPPKALTP